MAFYLFATCALPTKLREISLSGCPEVTSFVYNDAVVANVIGKLLVLLRYVALFRMALYEFMTYDSNSSVVDGWCLLVCC